MPRSHSIRPSVAGIRIRLAVAVAACFLAAATLSWPVSAVDPSPPSQSPGQTPGESGVPTPPLSSPQPSESPSASPSEVPQPPPGVELVEMRTADSQTFETPEGTFVTEVTAAPRFYQPEGSTEWQPIDLAFDPMPDGQGAIVADGGPVLTSLRPPMAGTDFLSLSSGGLTFGLRLPTPVQGQPMTNPSVISEGIFAEVIGALPGGIDLRVFAQADGATTFLVFHQRPTQSSFTFLIDAPGLTLEAEEDGAISLRDGQGVGHGLIPMPWMVDSSVDERRGGGFVSNDVAMTLGQVEGLPAITITPDPAFLDTATYPVFLDPSTTDFPSDAGTSYDTFAKQYSPDSNFNTYQRPDSPYYHEMWLGEAPGVDGYTNRVFIKFGGLADIIDDAHIDSADLTVMPYHQYYAAPTAKRTWIRQLTEGWNAADVTWNEQPDHGALASGDPAYADLTKGTTGHFDVTHTVQDWMDDGTKLGFMLWKGGGTTDREYDETYWTRLIADEGSSTDQPHLVVHWHRPATSSLSPTSNAWVAGRTLSWTYADGDGDSGTNIAQSHLQVQVATNSGFTTGLTDSGVVASSTASYTIPGGVSLTDGTTYYWRVKVKDGTGWSDWSSTGSFRLDSVAPTAAISPPAESADLAGTINVIGTAADATSFNKYTLMYGVGSSPSTWIDIGTNPRTSQVSAGGSLGSWSTSGLSGSYTIRLRVYDEPRLTSGFTELSRHVTVGTGPVASISTPTASAYVSGAALAIVGSASGGSFGDYTLRYGATCSPSSWSNIGSSPYSTPVPSGTLGTWDTTAVSDGIYKVKVVTTTNAGTASAEVCMTVDNTDPGATIAWPVESASVSGTVAVSGYANDATSFDHYVLDYGSGGSPSSWTTLTSSSTQQSPGTLGSWDTSGLSYGSYTLRLRVWDGTHQPLAAVLRHVSVDSAPIAAVTAPTASAFVAGTLAVTGTASGPGFTSYTLERGSTCSPSSWTAIGTNPHTTSTSDGTLGSWETTGVGDGMYAIRLTTTTTGGSATTTVCVTVDNTAPTAGMTSPAASVGVYGTVAITGSASDATSFVGYDLDYGSGSSPSSWTAIGTNPHTSPVTSGSLGTWNTAGLSYGTYTIRLRVWDGTHQPVDPQVVLSVVLGDAPFADITDPSASEHVGGTITISGTAVGAGFTGYDLEFGSTCSPSSWTAIGTNPHTSPMTAGTLDSWDTTVVDDGDYAIRLTTTATSGSDSATQCVTVENTTTVELYAETPSEDDLDFATTPVDGELIADGGPVTVVMREPDTDTDFLSLSADSLEIGLRLPTPIEAPEDEPTITSIGSYATVVDLLPEGVDLRVFARPDGAKTYLVLNEQPEAASFTILIDAPGLVVEASADEDGSIDVFDADWHLVGHIPPPTMVDSTDDGIGGTAGFSSDLEMSLGELEDLPAVTITPDADFLAAADYPVFLDITLVGFPEPVPGRTMGLVSEHYPSTVFAQVSAPDDPDHHDLWLGESPDSDGETARVFVAFDDLPTGHVRSATLSVSPYLGYEAAPTESRTWLAQVTEPWSADRLSWDDQPATAEVAAGDDEYADMILGQEATFDVTATVRDWVDGISPALGFMLHKGANEYDEHGWQRLIADDGSGSAEPVLTITYDTLPGPTISIVSPDDQTWTDSLEFSWHFEGPGTQSHFQVQIGETFGFSVPMVDSGPIADEEAGSWTPEIELDGNKTYGWRVRASDGVRWSEWAHGILHYDLAPPTDEQLDAAFALAADELDVDESDLSVYAIDEDRLLVDDRAFVTVTLWLEDLDASVMVAVDEDDIAVNADDLVALVTEEPVDPADKFTPAARAQLEDEAHEVQTYAFLIGGIDQDEVDASVRAEAEAVYEDIEWQAPTVPDTDDQEIADDVFMMRIDAQEDAIADANADFVDEADVEATLDLVLERIPLVFVEATSAEAEDLAEQPDVLSVWAVGEQEEGKALASSGNAAHFPAGRSISLANGAGVTVGILEYGVVRPNSHNLSATRQLPGVYVEHADPIHPVEGDLGCHTESWIRTHLPSGYSDPDDYWHELEARVDDGYHATFVATAALASGVHGGGAPGALYMDISATSINGDLSTVDKKVVKAAECAIANGVRLVNVLNVSSSQNSQAQWGFVTEVAFDYLVDHYDVFVSVSAGNDVPGGYQCASPEESAHRKVPSPASAWNVLAIGGFDANKDRVWQTNGGHVNYCVDDPAHRMKPELIAPPFMSSWLPDPGPGDVERNASSGGTSFAAPLVAGSAATLIEEDWDVDNCVHLGSPSMPAPACALADSPQAIRAIFMAAGSYHRPTHADPLWQQRAGAGTLDLAAAASIVRGTHTSPNDAYRQVIGEYGTWDARGEIESSHCVRPAEYIVFPTAALDLPGDSTTIPAGMAGRFVLTWNSHPTGWPKIKKLTSQDPVPTDALWAPSVAVTATRLLDNAIMNRWVVRPADNIAWFDFATGSSATRYAISIAFNTWTPTCQSIDEVGWAWIAYPTP